MVAFDSGVVLYIQVTYVISDVRARLGLKAPAWAWLGEAWALKNLSVFPRALGLSI